MPYKSFREIAGEGGSVNASFQRAYQKTFLIESDTVTDSVFFIGSHPQLPKIFSQHPGDPLAFCTNIAPQQDSNNPLLWRVTCTYAYTIDASGSGGAIPTGVPAIDSQQQGKPPASRETDPNIRGNDYSYSTVVYGKRVVKKDTVIANKPFVNVVNDPISPKPEVELYALQIRVGRNMPGAPNLEWLRMNGKLNANKCIIGTHVCEPGTARMMNTTAELVYENGTSYWRWTHDIILQEDRTDWMWSGTSQGYNAIMEFANGPIGVGALVKKKGKITDLHRELAGEQILTEDGSIWSLDQTKIIHEYSFNYIERANVSGGAVMAENIGYTLDYETIQWIARAIKKMERDGASGGLDGNPLPAVDGESFIQVTGAALATAGYYPAIEKWYDAAAGSWLYSTEPCIAWEINGGTLTNGSTYKGTIKTSVSDGGTVRNVFSVQASGGSGGGGSSLVIVKSTTATAGVVSTYNGTAWTDGTTSVQLVEANGNTIPVGKRMLALQVGTVYIVGLDPVAVTNVVCNSGTLTVTKRT